MNKTLSIEDIHNRIGKLLHIENPESFMNNQVKYLKLNYPEITNEKAEDYFIMELLQKHNDVKLDYLWYSFRNNNISKTNAA